MSMESPDFFSEGLLHEPLSTEDLQQIAQLTQTTETKGFYDNETKKIFFTDKGVATTFVFDESAQRFVIERTYDLMADPDAHTHQGSRPLEGADDINQERAAVLHEALLQLRNQDLIED